MLLRSGGALCAALLCLTGCPQPIGGECGDGGHDEPDGGAQNGQDGGADAGADGGPGDAGTDGGTDGGNPEEFSRADAGVFAWGTMPGAFVNEEVNVIHGATGDAPYLVTEKGRVRQWREGDWQLAWQNAVSGGPALRGLYVTPSGKVFAGGLGLLLHCTGPECTAQTHFTETEMTAPLGGSVYGMCGRGEDAVYAVGYYSTSGRVYRFDTGTGTWKTHVQDSGTGSLYGCWVAPDGTLFASTTSGRMVRVDGSGVAYVELVNSTAEVAANTHSFRAVHGAGGRIFATGSGRKVIERDPLTRTWNFVFTPTSTSDLHFAMGGGASDEIFAGGVPYTDRRLTRFDGDAWTFLKDMEGSITFSMTVLSIWAPGPDQLYLAGHKTYDGVIVKGVR